VVEHFLGKEEVVSSILINGSMASGFDGMNRQRLDDI
jgi:hypothetical protein